MKKPQNPQVAKQNRGPRRLDDAQLLLILGGAVGEMRDYVDGKAPTPPLAEQKTMMA
jgi:hypothetical protein